jgi:beta-glucosidase
VYYNHKSGGGKSQMLGDYIDSPTRPLFAFGHGLGYTHFEYGALHVAPERPTASETVEIALDLANTGERDGEEVVQLYLRDVVASLTRPVKQLAGFARLPLRAGESRRVVFALDPGQLAFYDARMRLTVEPGEIEVMVGASSEDIRSAGRFEIQGKARELEGADITPTRVRIEPPS